MPIDTKHTGYDEKVSKIELVRDFYDGELEVKEAGQKYLPALTLQTLKAYKAYKGRATLIPAVKASVKAITGALTRKTSTLDFKSVDPLSVNGAGMGEKVFTTGLIKELLLAGGVGVLVEWINDRPALLKYTQENILNYSYDYIVLMQSYEKRDDKDRYLNTTEPEILELYLEDGIYYQRIWRKDLGKWSIYSTYQPTIRGEAIREIPFYCGSITGDSMQGDDPVLLDLALVNLSQYKQSADYKHGLHFTALPTLFVFGVIEDEDGNRKAINIGAGSFNHIEDTEARAELLEFTGAGLGAIEKSIDSDIKTMASLAAKVLAETSKGVKSAETARIESSAESATLSTIADAIDNLYTQCLEFADQWRGTTGSTFEINRDFADVSLDHQTLTAYLTAMQAGGMSLDTFLNLLERGELLPKGVTAEQEAQRIQDGGQPFQFSEM